MSGLKLVINETYELRGADFPRDAKQIQIVGIYNDSVAYRLFDGSIYKGWGAGSADSVVRWIGLEGTDDLS